jgi:hypothetical protein
MNKRELLSVLCFADFSNKITTRLEPAFDSFEMSLSADTAVRHDRSLYGNGVMRVVFEITLWIEGS